MHPDLLDSSLCSLCDGRGSWGDGRRAGDGWAELARTPSAPPAPLPLSALAEPMAPARPQVPPDARGRISPLAERTGR